MKRMTLLLTMFICILGCQNKSDYSEKTIDLSEIIGEWVQLTEGVSEVKYTFSEDGTCEYKYTHLNDYFWGEYSTCEYDYTVSADIITLESVYESEPIVCKILKLNDSVLEWEYLSEHQRFERVK